MFNLGQHDIQLRWNFQIIWLYLLSKIKYFFKMISYYWNDICVRMFSTALCCLQIKYEDINNKGRVKIGYAEQIWMTWF